jgi:PKD repeat protein
MKNPALIIVIFLHVTLNTGCVYKKTDVKSALVAKDKKNNKDSEEIGEGSEADQASAYNFNMTRDPQLGYVPTERLQIIKNLLTSSPTRSSAQCVNWTERGPGNIGGRTRALMFDPNDPTHKTVWAGGVNGGLWVTKNITVSNPGWTLVDDLWEHISISCVVFDPTSQSTFYAGTGEGYSEYDEARGAGIWKSINGGQNWIQLNSTVPTSINPTFNYIQEIVINSSGTIFAATKNGGVQKSTDGGLTWIQSLGDQSGLIGNALPGGGVINVPANDIADLKIGKDGTLFASVGINYWSAHGEIYRSTNNGISWIKISDSNTIGCGFATYGTFMRVELECAPSDKDIIYAFLVDNGSTPNQYGFIQSVYSSTDKGTHWNQRTLPLQSSTPNSGQNTQAWHDVTAVVDPNDPNVVYTNDRVDIWKSTDGCQTTSNWHQQSIYYPNTLTNYTHEDQQKFVFEPGSSSTMLIGGDGGIFYSTNINSNGTPLISNKNGTLINGYRTTQFYSCAMSPDANSNVFLGGTQDNQNIIFKPGSAGISDGTLWGDPCDGGYCFIDKYNNAYRYITSKTFNEFYISTTGIPGSFTLLPNIFHKTGGRFINPCDYDYRTHTLYKAFGYSIDRNDGIFGTPTSATFPISDGTNTISSIPSYIKVSPYLCSHGNTILYIGTGPTLGNFDIGGQLWMVEDANTNTPIFSQINSPVNDPYSYISCIDIGAQDSNLKDQLLITYSNYTTTFHHVYESLDGGVTYSNKDGNLPDFPVRCALYNPNDRREVFLGTEIGVWSTQNINTTTPSWNITNSATPNSRVDMMRYRASDGQVLIATHGRGLFSTGYFNHPNAKFTIPSASSCTNETVSFIDQSTNNPTSWNWDFGDGTTSTDQNPVHHYNINSSQTFQVTLTVSNLSGCNSYTLTIISIPTGTCCSTFGNSISEVDFNSTVPINGNYNVSNGGANVIIHSGSNCIIDNAQLAFPPNCQVIVENGATLSVKNSSYLFSCSDMWEGISVNPGGNLFIISPSSMSKCKIEDAKFGVVARDGSNIYIDGCEFKNNFIGIKLSETGSPNPITINGYITNSDFFSSGLLRNGNPSSTPDPLTHSFAGIWSENVSYFNIGAGGYYTPGVSMNYFYDMNFGIYSLNSFLDISRYRFKKIKMFDSFDGMPYISINAKPIMLGTAVFSGGNQSNSFLNMNGRNSATDPDFDECYKAIQSLGANVDIRRNRIINCDDGVLVRQGHNLNIVIVQNYIDCNARGISLLLNGQSQQTFLQHNEIHGGLRQYRVNGSISKAIGIQTAEFNSTNPNAIINQNIIHLYNYGRIGIQSNAAERYIINYNTINLHNQINNTMVGISLSGSHANNINCNSVQGTFSGQLNYQNNEICFDIFDSRSNEIKCNTATNTSIGFRFSADCHGGNGLTNFRSNDIGNHFNGLLYTASALVDPQLNRGNWWYLNTYPGYAAVNLNPDHAWVANEKYEVWANLGSHANLPISTEIFVQAAVPWFSPVPTFDDNCGGPIHHSDCLFYTVNDGSGGGSYAADLLIALDSLNSSSYDEETKWKDKEALYEKLMLMPAYMDSSSILTDFYQNLAGTTIQQVASFHVSHNEIPSNESSLLQILENNSMSMYVKVDSIRACDSTLAIIGLSDSLKEIIKLKRKILVQQVKQTVTFNNQAFITLDSVVVLNADLLNDANDLINSSEIYEQNEQVVNEAFLNTIEINEPELIYNYAASILSVAQQCPLAGGPAVHRARSLYMLINPDMVYNDELTCLQNGWLLKLAKDNQQLPVGVFPNPASIEVTITYSISNDQILQVIDNLGGIQMEILLNSNENRITTNISSLSNGIYTLHLGNKNNHENTMGRLTIIK